MIIAFFQIRLALQTFSIGSRECIQKGRNSQSVSIPGSKWFFLICRMLITNTVNEMITIGPSIPNKTDIPATERPAKNTINGFYMFSFRNFIYIYYHSSSLFTG